MRVEALQEMTQRQTTSPKHLYFDPSKAIWSWLSSSSLEHLSHY